MKENHKASNDTFIVIPDSGFCRLFSKVEAGDGISFQVPKKSTLKETKVIMGGFLMLGCVFLDKTYG